MGEMEELYFAHYHIGSNDPGCLPDNAPDSADGAEEAVSILRSNLAEAQDAYYQSCENDAPDGCPCDWCTAAREVQSTLDQVDDGTILHRLASEIGDTGELSVYLFPPQGSDEVHWIRLAIDCTGDETE